MASALLAGALAASPCNRALTESAVPEAKSGEADSCARYAHDRTMDVCEGKCREHLFGQVASMIETDCEQGVFPEPGSDLDECDLKGLRTMTKAYLKSGEFLGQQRGYRTLGYWNCLKDKGFLSNPGAKAATIEATEAQPDTLDAKEYAYVRDFPANTMEKVILCQANAKNEIMRVCSNPGVFCTSNEIMNGITNMTHRCLQGESLPEL